MFIVGNKIRIKRKPISWSSYLGDSPLYLNYPKEFVIESIKTSNNGIYSMGTEDGYGFSLSSLIGDNNIELISSDEPNNKQRTIKMKLNSMMKRLLDENTKKLIRAGIINGDLELTEKGNEALTAIMFDEKKEELVKIAEEMIAEAKEK